MNRDQGPCTAFYAFSRQGLALAQRLVGEMSSRTPGQAPADIFAPERLAGHAGHAGRAATPFASIQTLLAETFGRYQRHVFVGAAGIAVRAIAPCLRGKAQDPAVAVLDQQARFAISLVSGHIGGANALARELAELSGATPVITTGTDVAGLPAVDELAAARGMVVENLAAAKGVSAALLEGRLVQLFDPEGRLLDGLDSGFGSGSGRDPCTGVDAGGLFAPTQPEDWNPAAPGVWCHWRAGGLFASTFRVYPRCLCLGLGSRKGVPKEEICAHVATVFARAGLSPQSVVAVGTATIKRDDPGLCDAAAALGPEVVFYEPEALAAVLAAGQSETVKGRTGTGSVSEAAALLLANGGELVSAKTKTERVTCAVALRRKGA